MFFHLYKVDCVPIMLESHFCLHVHAHQPGAMMATGVGVGQTEWVTVDVLVIVMVAVDRMIYRSIFMWVDVDGTMGVEVVVAVWVVVVAAVCGKW